MKPNTDTISLSEYADKLEHQQIKELEDKISQSVLDAYNKNIKN